MTDLDRILRVLGEWKAALGNVPLHSVELVSGSVKLMLLPNLDVALAEPTAIFNDALLLSFNEGMEAFVTAAKGGQE